MTSAERTWARFRRVAYSAGARDSGRPTAAFDFDSTLRPYRGRGPPEELTLRFLAGLAGGFNLVVVSNRSSADPAALAPLRQYAAALDARGARATYYAPTAHDRDRKPHTGVWEHYCEGAAGGAAPFAFFCGDAAGRPGDFSAADLLFAHNNGLAFVTPEDLFGGGGDPWAAGARLLGEVPGLLCLQRARGAAAPPDPLADLLEGDGAGDGTGAGAAARQPVCVIMCGSPASGKSRLAARLTSRGWAIASRDVQWGAKGADRTALARALGRRESVVVDNTNPTRADRAEAAAIVGIRGRGYRVVICHVATPKGLCFHLNGARCQLDPTGGTAEVPDVAIHTYWKRREPPDAAEAAALGAELREIPFALDAGAPPEVTHLRYARA